MTNAKRSDPAGGPRAARVARAAMALMACLALPAEAYDTRVAGFVAADLRAFPQDAQFEDQFNGLQMDAHRFANELIGK
mgnify:CR=1 FL=1